MSGYRQPYVGSGVDGARRSGQVDREEADTLPAGHERRWLLLASAERWERQASDMEGREVRGLRDGLG